MSIYSFNMNKIKNIFKFTAVKIILLLHFILFHCEASVADESTNFDLKIIPRIVFNQSEGEVSLEQIKLDELEKISFENVTEYKEIFQIIELMKNSSKLQHVTIDIKKPNIMRRIFKFPDEWDVSVDGYLWKITRRITDHA